MINAFGASLCAIVLVIVIVTKFTKGAYLVLIAMPILYALMRAIHRHYSRVYDELASTEQNITLPARNHVIVLVSRVHKPTLRALAFARATHPDTLTALTVDVDKETTRALMKEWEARDLPVKLKVLESPYREVTRPILNYVRELRADRPNDVVSVFIPEYVVGHWWEQLLHNQQALRLKGRLLFQPGVMVTSVPWQLGVERGGVRAGTVAPGRAGRARPRDATRRSAVVVTERRCSNSRSARPAHGGSCVARHDGGGWSSCGTRCRASGSGRVVTEESGTYLRADAVEMLERVAGPGRAAVPARRAGPLRRLRLAARVRLRAARAEGGRGARAVRPGRRGWTCDVVGRGAARRAARLADAGSRTRSTRAGRPGLHRHRSHEVEHVGALPARHARGGRQPRARRAVAGRVRRRGRPRGRRRGRR